MLKMVIRMNEDKIRNEKSTVWTESIKRLTTHLSK